MTTPPRPPAYQVSLPVEGPLTPDAFFAGCHWQLAASALPPLPRLVFGTARLGWAKSAPEIAEAVATLQDAWRAGFLWTDTAPKYGDAELIVGEALRTWSGPDPVLCTKAGHEHNQPRYRREELQAIFERATDRFGRRPDLLAIHEPEICPPDLLDEAAGFITGLVQRGQTKGAGLGGGNVDGQGRFLARGRFHYMLTYLRVGALSLQGLVDQVPQARRAGLSVWGASPLFMGLLGDQFDALLARPPRWCGPAMQARTRRVAELAREAALPLPRLALRFLLSMPALDAVVAGAATRAQWADTLAAYQAGPLPADLYRAIWLAAQQGEEPSIGG